MTGHWGMDLVGVDGLGWTIDRQVGLGRVSSDEHLELADG